MYTNVKLRKLCTIETFSSNRVKTIFSYIIRFIMHPRIESDRHDDAFSSFLRSSLLSLGIYYEYIHCKNDSSNFRNRWSIICDITFNLWYVRHDIGRYVTHTDICRISIYMPSPEYTNYFIMTKNHRFFSLFYETIEKYCGGDQLDFT